MGVPLWTRLSLKRASDVLSNSSYIGLSLSFDIIRESIQRKLSQVSLQLEFCWLQIPVGRCVLY